jgi:hypothetical protein
MWNLAIEVAGFYHRIRCGIEGAVNSAVFSLSLGFKHNEDDRRVNEDRMRREVDVNVDPERH